MIIQLNLILLVWANTFLINRYDSWVYQRTGQFAGCSLSRLNLQVEFAGQIGRSNLQVKKIKKYKSKLS